MLRALLGWLARVNPSNWFGPGDTRLDRWYDRSGVFKYRPGQRIRIRARNIVGYGVDACGVIVETARKENGEDFYVVDMSRVAGANWLDWMESGSLPENPERVTARQNHFKWNVEHHFVRA